MKNFVVTSTVALVLAVPSFAFADDAANTATARALGVEGVTLADAGKCKEAIEKLARAEELHHAPTTATRLGECEIETGKLVAGTERLQRVIREPLPPNAHPAFGASVARAQKVLDKHLPRLATIHLSVKAPAGTKMAIVIDEEHAPQAILDTPRKIDPGAHKIRVTAPGMFPADANVTVDEGGTKNVSLELKPDPNAPKVRPEGEPTLETSSSPSKAPAIVAFGIGAVGLGVGIFGGLKVASASSDLDNACDPNRVCPTSRQSDIDGAKTWATVSTVGFAVAGVGIATGVVLLVAGGSGAKETARKTTKPHHGVSVKPDVGLGSAGINGTF